MHEAKLAKMEAEMKMVFQQKVQEKEAKLKQSEEELYARHREMKEALEKQRLELEDKKRRIESGRPLTPENKNVSLPLLGGPVLSLIWLVPADKEEGLLASLICLCLLSAALLCRRGTNPVRRGVFVSQSLSRAVSCYRTILRNDIRYSSIIVSFVVSPPNTYPHSFEWIPDSLSLF